MSKEIIKSFIDKMVNRLKLKIYGERAAGEPIGEPNFKVTYPKRQLKEADWMKQMKVGIGWKDREPIHNANRMMSMWNKPASSSFMDKMLGA